ncbi:unnamed protein product [Bemisia tabaci]|uniref:Uncharacterized protein n=1 Tax=Bemisia tabaci TaxID=7038 RepID=A0A9P0F7F4_BEMTA|nr:unnamed protein product [Bemisia tabaci]
MQKVCAVLAFATIVSPCMASLYDGLGGYNNVYPSCSSQSYSVGSPGVYLQSGTNLVPASTSYGCNSINSSPYVYGSTLIPTVPTQCGTSVVSGTGCYSTPVTVQTVPTYITSPNCGSSTPVIIQTTPSCGCQSSPVTVQPGVGTYITSPNCGCSSTPVVIQTTSNCGFSSCSSPVTVQPYVTTTNCGSTCNSCNCNGYQGCSSNYNGGCSCGSGCYNSPCSTSDSCSSYQTYC